MTYYCPRCKKEFDEFPRGVVRCPYCGSRIILKARPPVVKVVIAV